MTRQRQYEKTLEGYHHHHLSPHRELAEDDRVQNQEQKLCQLSPCPLDPRFHFSQPCPTGVRLRTWGVVSNV